ncbi:DUF4391 domain-containing protein [Aeromonas bestiarum]|uniref:DUF4391 domain-containing protein n=1 Tax=Aeromonas bestiarum TaxID=105751 RepID=A0AAW7HTC7_9GAMM|nr:DUF4391 domain-containing protein [Aeromonas bestiarum]MDM5138791.1 DUF4391 domain-containing protein [Aeromonas bestiarum]
MIPHYRFPATTALNHRLPKETLYQRLNPTVALKQAFIGEVQEIHWRHKLAADTLNLASSADYPELQVFDIELKAGVSELSEAILHAIDALIVFPIFYRLTRVSGDNTQVQYQLAYKAPAVAGSDKVKLGRYFASPWLPLPSEAMLAPLPMALDMGQLYRQLLQPLVESVLSAGSALILASLPNAPWQPRTAEPLSGWMDRLDEGAKLEKRITRLQGQLAREKQFNRKIELNRELYGLTQALLAL